MITQITNRNISKLSYIDDGQNMNISIEDHTDNSDYIEISFDTVPVMVIPKCIIPELKEILEKFR